MKKLNFILVFLATTLISYCGDAQTVKGSGSVTSKTISMDKITSIGLGISADVYLRQGAKQEIEIKGQQNIIDLLNKRPNGKSWNIEFERGTRVKSYEQLEIYITLTELENLSIGGSGSIIGKSKFTRVDDLSISIGGSGDVKVDVEANDISCSIGGSGKIKLQGEADELEVSIGGSGDVEAINLDVKECNVSSAGSGNVEINVSDYLKVSLVGSGDVRYSGNPKVKKSIVGSGDVVSY